MKPEFRSIISFPEGLEDTPFMKNGQLNTNTPLIHTSFTCAKWNMGEIFGLKFHTPYVHKQ